MIMNDDLVMISTTLKVAEKAKVIYKETPNYTKEELFADIGGALGLFLGFGSLNFRVLSTNFRGKPPKRTEFIGRFCFLWDFDATFGTKNYRRDELHFPRSIIEVKPT